jgi:peptide/nickel transport system substrate-binding protein
MNLKKIKILRGCLVLWLFLTLLLASCAPQPDSAPISIPSPIESPAQAPAHAPEIRFALIGKPHDVNVWQLFNESGATYADYALRSEYWPRLYHLAPQDFSFQPYAAEGLPSEVTQDGGLYSATVKLRPNLQWTDGSSFTAEDIAFTVNAALAFELGYDWNTYYPREVLDHAEAVDPSTVKFVFKQKPNVGIWQYGVLQGPIVQKAFWESTVKDAAKLLPTDTLRMNIDEARTNLTTAQADFDRVNAQVLSLKLEGKQNRKLDGEFLYLQGEATYAQNNLNKLLEDYAAQVISAQETLYAAGDEKEPTLGAWMPAEMKNDVWVNKVNPDFPFSTPNFDRSTYRFFEDEEAALTAFQNGEVDFILSPSGISSDAPNAKYNPSYSARFLVFNPLNGYLADPAFRSALACMIDRKVLANDILQNKAAPLDSFVLSSQWHDANLKDACAGMDKSARVEYAVKLLRDAGYSWAQEPNSESAGQNLVMSNGEAFPKITLLAPSKEADALRYAAANYIAEQAQYLGVSLVVQEVSLNDVVYAVYSSQKYDMALMGWRLSEYPAYLCEWFGGENLYLYNSNRLKAACDVLGGESNLDAARQAVGQIETALISELPFIPLFTVMQADMYRNLSYPTPAANILNGWSGLYGAPSYAIPAQ